MKIRIGNDFKTKWAITWLGEPEDFSDATDIALFFNIYDKKIELTKDVDYTITDNIIEIDVTPDICNILGVYNLELHYTKPNSDFIDGERRSAVDIDAFRIVGKSEKADSTQDVSIISDAVVIFLDIAYKKLEEIEANEDVRIANENEREDAEDIRVSNEDIRISNEQDRQINTTTAISNAEQATLNANNSAVYANEQGSYAEEMSSHPPTIIDDYWYIWNFITNQYESTGQYARGDSAIDGALVVQEKGQSAVNTMSQKAVTDELVQLAGDVSVLDNKTLNIKPINLFEWGRLNALGFYAGANTNYTINELGHIITTGTFLIDIPVTHLRGKRIFFGTKKKSSYLDFCQFYNGSTQLSSPAPVNTLLGIDENGFSIISITHPSNGDIVPLDATHIKIQYRINVEIVEIYAGETPYTGDTLYPQDFKTPEPYKYLGGTEIATLESSISRPNQKGVATFNPDGTISIDAGGNTSIDVGFILGFDFTKIRGKELYMNLKATNTVLRGIYIQLIAYNVVNGVHTLLNYSYFSISSGELTILPLDIPQNSNKMRLIVKAATGDSITINSISFSESKHYSTDIKVFDDTSTALLKAKAYTDTKISGIANISERETLYEAMQENLQNVLVGTKQFRKVTEDNVTNITDEVNNPKIYYSPRKRIPSKVQNLIVVDTKGIVQDEYNRGRILEWISPDGWMYFRNGYYTYQKISVETFLSNLRPHDGSGITSDNIDWLELPAEQTIAEKAAKLAEELPNWKMHDETKSSDFQTVYSEAGVGWITRQMANGSLVNQNRLIRKDGTVVQPILKNPVVCNPTHLIIKENGSVLYEIPLKNAALSTGIKWGEMKANQGDITYVDNIYAAINFNHNKSIIIDGINLLSGHTYDFTLRGRRYGTNCVNGSVNIINVETIGSIPLTDTIMGGNNSATLVDNTATITLNKNITGVTLRANAPTEKSFNYGNGATATPNAGYMASDDKMLITEYEPTKRAGMAYLSQDNGESYDVLFDASLNENFCNVGGGHIHGGCFDPYWNKVVLLLGDSDFAKGIYHADYINGINQDTVNWVREVPPNPFYGAANGEQHSSAYPHEDFILFGTDCVPTGIFRMPRINKKEFTKREPSKLISGGNLSHIPAMYFRENENSPIFIATKRGGYDHPDRLYNTSIYYATWDGIYVQEIFKDKIRCAGFGNNSFMGIFYYKGKVFMTQFGDNRFENRHTLFIGDYMV